MKKKTIFLGTLLTLGFACFSFASCNSCTEEGASRLFDARWDLDNDGDYGDRSGEYNPSFKGGGMQPIYRPGKTCNHGGCRCDGYKGYRSPGGPYKGKCLNSDGWGHLCGHSPSDHGL